ncbi:MAG: protease complex subunit PrcB family protein [Lachnospiraceae bacterium]|nr:protease complex subunit PrcB family protein [Lachnospiraceae bacterium]
MKMYRVKRREKRLSLFLMFLMIFAAAGCGKKEESVRTDVDFSVITAGEVPQELAEIIEKNEENEMRLAWKTEDALYLVRGYGKQSSGGYSVAVAECTEDEEYLWFDTRLIGPQDPDNLSQEPSYPCLVVKIAPTEKEVIIN